MAFHAMAGTVHEIGAAIPFGGLGRIGLEGGVIEEQELPPADRAAIAEYVKSLPPLEGPPRPKKKSDQDGK